MKSLTLLLFTILSTSVMAASDCQLAFDEVKFYDHSGVVDWKEGEGLKKTYPELTTLTPEIPESLRLQIMHRGNCQLDAEVKVSIFGLKGEYASGDDPHHEAHGKAPEGSEWTSNSIWSKTVKFSFAQGERSFSLADIPIEKILLSVPEENWYWSLRFQVEIREKGKDKILWEKTEELSAPLVH